MRKRRQLEAVVSLLAVLALAGCQSSNQQTENPPPETAGGGHAHKAEAREVTVTVPAGTALAVRLGDSINTGTTSEGASFEGTLAAALTAEGVEVAPVGSKVTGKVTHVVSSGRLNRPAELALVLTSLATPQAGTVDLSTDTWGAKGASHKKRDLELIGGGGGAGALIGALAGGKKGALIGGAVGAGGGTAVAAATGKKEIVLAPETELNFKLAAPLTLTIKK